MVGGHKKTPSGSFKTVKLKEKKKNIIKEESSINQKHKKKGWYQRNRIRPKIVLIASYDNEFLGPDS